MRGLIFKGVRKKYRSKGYRSKTKGRFVDRLLGKDSHIKYVNKM